MRKLVTTIVIGNFFIVSHKFSALSLFLVHSTLFNFSHDSAFFYHTFDFYQWVNCVESVQIFLSPVNKLGLPYRGISCNIIRNGLPGTEGQNRCSKQIYSSYTCHNDRYYCATTDAYPSKGSRNFQAFASLVLMPTAYKIFNPDVCK